MRKAAIYQQQKLAGILQEIEKGKQYRFIYQSNYVGEPISLTMPTEKKVYEFDHFPSVFEGLLPEGPMLEGMLKINKLDRKDLLAQLIAVGGDVVGSLTIAEINEE